MYIVGFCGYPVGQGNSDVRVKSGLPGGLERGEQLTHQTSSLCLPRLRDLRLSSNSGSAAGVIFRFSASQYPLPAVVP